MKKTLTLMIVTLFILMSFASPVWAEDDPALEETGPVPNTYSIGINNLPWHTTGVSLRWWKNEGAGGEFIISGTGGGVMNHEMEEEYQTGDFDISGLRYYWLRREENTRVADFYYIWGSGIGFDYTQSTRFTGNSTKIQLDYYWPMGIEHFFLKNYSNISYSIQADFCVQLSYWNFNSGSEHITANDLSFGVIPRFYLRYYFK
jgi:hypothetical protein